METFFLAIQILLAVLITGAILLQSQGSGLGAAWGGGGETYHTKRGVEKLIFYATIIMIGLFILVSIGSLVLK